MGERLKKSNTPSINSVTMKAYSLSFSLPSPHFPHSPPLFSSSHIRYNLSLLSLSSLSHHSLFYPQVLIFPENLWWICGALISRTPIWVRFCCGIRFPRGRFHAIWPRSGVSGLKMGGCSRSGLLRARLPRWLWEPWARRTMIIPLLLVISFFFASSWILDFESLIRWKNLINNELEVYLCEKFWAIFSQATPVIFFFPIFWDLGSKFVYDCSICFLGKRV